MRMMVLGMEIITKKEYYEKRSDVANVRDAYQDGFLYKSGQDKDKLPIWTAYIVDNNTYYKGNLTGYTPSDFTNLKLDGIRTTTIHTAVWKEPIALKPGEPLPTSPAPAPRRRRSRVA